MRRAIALSIVAHAIVGFGGRWVLHDAAPVDEVIDVELAPEAPKAEALPEEHERPPEQQAEHKGSDEAQEPASTAPKPAETEGVPVPVDAAVDAPPPIDAAPARWMRRRSGRMRPSMRRWSRKRPMLRSMRRSSRLQTMPRRRSPTTRRLRWSRPAPVPVQVQARAPKRLWQR